MEGITGTMWQVSSMAVEANHRRHYDHLDQHGRVAHTLLMSAVLVLIAKLSMMAFVYPMRSSITGHQRVQSQFLMRREAIGLEHQHQQEQAMPAVGDILPINAEEDLAQLIKKKADFVVKLGFTWCRPCKAFLPRYKKLAKIYGETHFLKVTGNENEWSKTYARDVLRISETPTFAAYSAGELVATWTGGDAERFVRTIEKTLPSAAGKFKQAVLAAGCN